jgi:hypothetical protein
MEELLPTSASSVIEEKCGNEDASKSQTSNSDREVGSNEKAIEEDGFVTTVEADPTSKEILLTTAGENEEWASDDDKNSEEIGCIDEIDEDADETKEQSYTSNEVQTLRHTGTVEEVNEDASVKTKSGIYLLVPGEHQVVDAFATKTAKSLDDAINIGQEEEGREVADATKNAMKDIDNDMKYRDGEGELKERLAQNRDHCDALNQDSDTTLLRLDLDHWEETSVSSSSLAMSEDLLSVFGAQDSLLQQEAWEPIPHMDLLIAKELRPMADSTLDLAVDVGARSGGPTDKMTVSTIFESASSTSSRSGTGTTPMLTTLLQMVRIDKFQIAQFALSAMNELVQMAQRNRPLWVSTVPSLGSLIMETLNYKEHLVAFSPCVGVKPTGFMSEVSRELGIVTIGSSAALVKTFMDQRRWLDIFCCRVATTAAVEKILPVAGSRNGALLLMHAELQVFSPLVKLLTDFFWRELKHTEAYHSMCQWDPRVDQFHWNDDGSKETQSLLWIIRPWDPALYYVQRSLVHRPCSKLTFKDVLPEEIVDRRLVKKGGRTVPHVLVRRSRVPHDSATWEEFSIFRQLFPRTLAWGQASFPEGANVTTEESRESESCLRPMNGD